MTQLSNAASKSALTFEKDVRPILKAHCFHCHGEGEKLKGDLDVRLAHFLTKGGESGPALVPGKPDKSLLIRQVQNDEMPKGEKKLTAAEKDVLKRWVASGAKTARPEPAELGKGPLFTEEEKQFWAFQPIQNPPVPKVRKKDLVRNPIDAFLLQKLSEKNLSYAPPADRVTLIRRVSFDLLGLPPSPEQIDQFVNDTSPDAYGKLVERLLASPAYGERWGRHWLDLAGYADSNGFTEADAPRAHAWRYRDYVIRSINDDKPLSEFIREQLAGDEIAGPVQKELTPRQIELLTATGFLRMAPDGTDESLPDANLARNQVIADTVKVVSSSLLGMTVACAQCHDHRYDPITIDDYYRMRAVFDPAFDWKNWRGPGRRLVSLYTEADRQKAREVEAEAVKIDQARKVKEDGFIQATFDKEVAKLPEELREPARVARSTAAGKRNAAQVKLMKEYPSLNVSSGSLYLYDKKAADELTKMSDEAAKIRANKPVENFVMAANEVPGKIPDSFVFNRGDHDQPKQKVEPGEFLILASLNPPAIPVKPAAPTATSGRRLAYANWLTGGSHPLVARVLVNRVWSEHFGRGIVATVGDFGRLGQRPSHPELLDWLATDFMSHGWSLKRLHRTILNSTAYRQSAARDSKKERIDPDNALLGRMNIRRLDSETLRDAMLAVSGKLNPAQFGPPVPIARHPSGRIVTGKEKLNTNREPIDVLPIGDDEYRRSVYVEVRRTRPLTLLETFDAPNMTPNCEARAITTVAPQSLLLMNDVFVVTQSREMAMRLEKEAGKEAAAQVNRAWKLLHGTAPTSAELERSLTFLREQTEFFKGNPVKPKKGDTTPAPGPEFHALASYCQVLLGSNRFLYIAGRNIMSRPNSTFCSRRHFLQANAFGLGTMALASLLRDDGLLAAPVKPVLDNVRYDTLPKKPHFEPKAKAMISLLMIGGPSQMDLFDPKPMLTKYHGQKFPGEIKYDNAAEASSKVFGSPWEFKKHGQCGMELSELLPHLGEVVDDITLVRSMRTAVNNHGQSMYALNTGRITAGRPALGSWLTYGLGSETRDLPAYVALTHPSGMPLLHGDNWTSGWLPSIYQGTMVRPTEPHILNLDPPEHIKGEGQVRQLELLRELNQKHLAQRPGELDLEARIASYELAARMQTAAREALDISKESKATLEMYGIDKPETKDYGTRCLTARRLVERGVRFVQVLNSGQSWDHHGSLISALPKSCAAVDKPCAALIKDLKALGLLDSTVVHWGGEMGRLPVLQNDTGREKWGRDHNTYGFSSWVAGGGFKGGYVHGETDEWGHQAVKDVVNHYDYHATLLQLFGLDYQKLTYKRNGVEQSLVDKQDAKIIQALLKA